MSDLKTLMGQFSQDKRFHLVEISNTHSSPVIRTIECLGYFLYQPLGRPNVYIQALLSVSQHCPSTILSCFLILIVSAILEFAFSFWTLRQKLPSVFYISSMKMQHSWYVYDNNHITNENLNINDVNGCYTCLCIWVHTNMII